MCFTDRIVIKCLDSPPSQTRSAESVTLEKIKSRELPPLKSSRDVFRKNKRDTAEILGELHEAGNPFMSLFVYDLLRCKRIITGMVSKQTIR